LDGFGSMRLPFRRHAVARLFRGAAFAAHEWGVRPGSRPPERLFALIADNQVHAWDGSPHLPAVQGWRVPPQSQYGTQRGERLATRQLRHLPAPPPGCWGLTRYFPGPIEPCGSSATTPRAGPGTAGPASVRSSRAARPVRRQACGRVLHWISSPGSFSLPRGCVSAHPGGR
jgi:hypothetical protein